MGHPGATCQIGAGGEVMVKTTAGFLVFGGVVIGMSAAIALLGAV